MSLERSLSKGENYLLIELAGTLAQNEPALMTLAQFVIAEATTHGRVKGVVINLGAVTQWQAPAIRTLVQQVVMLKIEAIPYRLINCADAIQDCIKQLDLMELTPNAPSLRSALHEMGIRAPFRMDAGFVNVFLSATMTALEVQAQITTTAGKPRLRGRDEALGDISGIIGVVSDTFNGSISISFPTAVFLGIVSRMLGSECKQIDPEIEDAAGELLNIIFGLAKTQLNRQGYALQQAIPSIVSGKGHSISQLSDGPRVVIPFSTPEGSFFVEVCLMDTATAGLPVSKQAA